MAMAMANAMAMAMAMAYNSITQKPKTELKHQLRVFIFSSIISRVRVS